MRLFLVESHHLSNGFVLFVILLHLSGCHKPIDRNYLVHLSAVITPERGDLRSPPKLSYFLQQISSTRSAIAIVPLMFSSNWALMLLVFQLMLCFYNGWLRDSEHALDIFLTETRTWLGFPVWGAVWLWCIISNHCTSR